MKKKIIFAILILVITLLCTACGVGSSSGDVQLTGTKTPSGEKTKWAVYVYLCGSDLESDGRSATTDLSEMLAANLGNDVKVVVETGGAKSWNNAVMPADRLGRYEISQDGLYHVGEEPQANMGDGGTLQSFLTFCKTNYPADHTALIFWNHGGGSASGVCFDENYNYDSLGLGEMDQALANGWGDSPKLDLIGADACLMATLDNASISQKYAHYLVASEELEPGTGWEYSAWLTTLGNNPEMAAPEVGKAICDAYQSGSNNDEVGDEITLSVVDLSKVAPLVAAVDNMGQEVLTSAVQNTKVIGQFGRSAKASENYGGNNDEDGYANMVDLGDLMKNANPLIGTADDQVVSALKDAVIYKVNGPYRSQASGLSAYYSYNGDRDELTAYAAVGASPNYTKYLEYSLGADVSEEVRASTGVDDIQTVQGFNQDLPLSIDQDNAITMQLDPDALNAVSSVCFDLAYLDTEHRQIVMLGTDNDIDANWDTGLFKDNFRGKWGAIDNHYAYMELTEEGDHYNRYSVPIYLNGEETKMSVAYDFDKDAYTILGVNNGIDPATGMAHRDFIKLKKGDKIELVTYAMSMDEGNDQLIEKKSDPIVYKNENQLKEIDLYNGDYAYRFSVKDTTGQEKSSDYAYITFEDGDISTSLD